MENISLTLQQVAPTAMQLENEKFTIVVDRPTEKGGSGLGLMGGQYLLIGIGGCFCSTLFAAAQSRNIEIEGLSVHVVATVKEALPKRFTKVSLEVSYTTCTDKKAFNKLLTIAEKGCISVNTVKSGLAFSVSEKDG